MFVPERNLKDLIVSYLRQEERSISALAKQLRRDGYKLHRLFVTGYLKALADVGMLREKEIPPAKVYSTAVHREKNLYEVVGDACREVESDPSRQARLAVAVLQRIFRRPVFLRELREAGFESGIDAILAEGPDRDEARRAFGKMGVSISAREPAYYVNERRNEVRDQVIVDLLVERFGVGDLVLGTKQTKLVRS